MTKIIVKTFNEKLNTSWSLIEKKLDFNEKF